MIARIGMIEEPIFYKAVSPRPILSHVSRNLSVSY
jgi:hypothetical protein